MKYPTVMQFSVCVEAPWRMNIDDMGDLVTFPSVAPADQSFHIIFYHIYVCLMKCYQISNSFRVFSSFTSTWLIWLLWLLFECIDVFVVTLVLLNCGLNTNTLTMVTHRNITQCLLNTFSKYSHSWCQYSFLISQSRLRLRLYFKKKVFHRPICVLGILAGGAGFVIEP